MGTPGRIGRVSVGVRRRGAGRGGIRFGALGEGRFGALGEGRDSAKYKTAAAMAMPMAMHAAGLLSQARAPAEARAARTLQEAILPRVRAHDAVPASTWRRCHAHLRESHSTTVPASLPSHTVPSLPAVTHMAIHPQHKNRPDVRIPQSGSRRHPLLHTLELSHATYVRRPFESSLSYPAHLTYPAPKRCPTPSHGRNPADCSGQLTAVD